MKVMHIESELIHIVCAHTECALSINRIKCTFSQSISIGGLQANCIITKINVSVIYSHLIDCSYKETSNKERNNKCNVIASLR